MASTVFNKTHLVNTGWTSNVTLPYTAPSDGFITIYLNPSSQSGGSTLCYIGGAPVGLTSSNGDPNTTCFPIKAGEKVTQSSLSGASLSVKFRAFNS